MRRLTASDRHRLIRLAANMPVGAPMRRAILAGLVKSNTKRAYKTFPTELTAAAVRAVRKNVFQNVEVVEFEVSTSSEDHEVVYGQTRGSWDEPPDELTTVIEFDVPDQLTDTVLLLVPSEIVMQIPEEDREEFMEYVMDELIDQMGASKFFEEMGNLETCESALRDNNESCSFSEITFKNVKVYSERIPGERVKVHSHEDHSLKMKLDSYFDLKFDAEMKRYSYGY
jgi:hypothetical protein